MRFLYIFTCLCFITNKAFAQGSLKNANNNNKFVILDSTAQAKHNPHLATMRSLIVPGWGQAYNREYWKIPVVYAAIGIPTGFYISSNTWYKRLRTAYTIVVTNDTRDFNKIDPQLFDKKTGLPWDAPTLQYLRNQYRQYRDYSLLAFIAGWALNVVDATVFGHLKEFDVSDDIAMQITPGYDATTKAANLAFVLNLKGKPHKISTIKQ